MGLAGAIRDLRGLAKLAAGYPGEAEEGVGPGEIAIPGTSLIVGSGGRIFLRDTIPGSSILLGGALASGRAADRSAARRLGRAVAIVDAAWPEAGAEIRERTRLVIPRDEPSLVSYSLPSRPGVSFINLRRKRLIDLADDLLHETAHHRLHAIEAARALVLAPRRPADGAELRYWSPWRRAQRPVRGILHAWYTFAFRAELFSRIVRKSRSGMKTLGPLPLREALVRELAHEARKERRWVAAALGNLRDAAGRGRLTAAGRRLIGL
jgi:HEXXH motif-containing protein